MIDMYEYLGESRFPRERGEIAFELDDSRPRPSVAWIVLKSVGSLILLATAYALLLPTFLRWMPVAQAATLATGVLMVYVGLAAVVRPRPGGNFGWAGGLFDDPTQYSDDINRSLFHLHMVLGPGRLISETAVDAASLLGIVRDQPVEVAPEDLPAPQDAESPAQSASS